MSKDTEDTRKPRGKCIQIKGLENDTLILRVEAYQKKIGLISVSTAVRVLLKRALDIEERKP
jgi:hypothetical protein